jgi:hypothetical protein
LEILAGRLGVSLKTNRFLASRKARVARLARHPRFFTGQAALPTDTKTASPEQARCCAAHGSAVASPGAAGARETAARDDRTRIFRSITRDRRDRETALPAEVGAGLPRRIGKTCALRNSRAAAFMIDCLAKRRWNGSKPCRRPDRKQHGQGGTDACEATGEQLPR